jgi:hypothetical protein
VFEPREFVWIEDSAPAGAALQGDSPWEFVTAPKHPVHSGEKSMRRRAKGFGQHFFEWPQRPLKLAAGDTLFAHVYLDPEDPPKAVMLQFRAQDWEHRSVWGEDVIPWGQSNTPSRRLMGPLPEKGKWVRLEVKMDDVGLAAGSGARVVFYEWSRFIRFLVIFFVLPLGMFVLGLLTSWEMGIGPLDPWIRKEIDPEQLIQLGGAFLVAIICLEAWWKPRPEVEDLPEPRAASNPRERTPAAALIRSAQPRGSQTRSQPKRNWRPKFLRANKSRGGARSAVNKIVIPHTVLSTPAKRKRPFSRKPKLQISVIEEHRCPYCLDVVKRNDPRGIKECEVCHSLHHADCWNITGMCQVPHLNG